ncbi:hypothetical protein DFH28DRAFT_1106919 [Melampsora americana]|nr:hypothetical protein DFH28DRAFT_1106919 [Melampsora americana]
MIDKTLLKSQNQSNESFKCIGNPDELIYENELDEEILNFNQNLQNQTQNQDQDPNPNPTDKSSIKVERLCHQKEAIQVNLNSNVHQIPIPSFYQIPNKSIKLNPNPSSNPIHPSKLDSFNPILNHQSSSSSSSNNFNHPIFQNPIFHSNLILRNQRIQSNSFPSSFSFTSNHNQSSTNLFQTISKPITEPTTQLKSKSEPILSIKNSIQSSNPISTHSLSLPNLTSLTTITNTRISSPKPSLSLSSIPEFTSTSTSPPFNSLLNSTQSIPIPKTNQFQSPTSFLSIHNQSNLNLNSIHSIPPDLISNHQISLPSLPPLPSSPPLPTSSDDHDADDHTQSDQSQSHSKPTPNPNPKPPSNET